MLPSPLNKLKKSFSNPVFWFGLILVIFSFYKYSGREEGQVIRSDMRGYYAYLPAMFTYNDASFQSSVEAESRYLEEAKKPNYLVKTENGSVHNKYFPGVAILQAPFYSAATVVCKVTGKKADGYSKVYQLFFQVGATFYALLGLILFYSLLTNLFPKNKSLIQWLIPMIYLATPLFHYSANTLSFSHSYSFFLFGLFAWFIVKMRREVNHWYFLGLGLTLGLIVLVRPTNLIILLTIPLLLGNVERLYSFFSQLTEKRAKKLIYGALGFLFILVHLFLIWKWESGNWFIWSYGGEGFNFLHPQIIASLFSFRVGLFLHTPLLILSIIGLTYLYRTSKFQAMWWFAYFTINCWIISSWWCWDYESAFGNRPYTEHLLFILIPVFIVLQQKKIAWYALLTLFTIVGLIRITTFNNGYMINQKFTADNYIASLAFWDDNNFDRWNFTTSCPPFGEKINEIVLSDHPGEFQVQSDNPFILTGETDLHQPRTNERFYFRASMDKMTSDVPLEGVSLVVDAKNKETGEFYYWVQPLYNDRLKGVKEWDHVEFSGLIPDNLQEFDHVKMYIWNREGKTFKVKNLKFVLEEYQN